MPNWRNYWQQRSTRLTVGLLLLIIAIVSQYFLVRRFSTIKLEGGKFEQIAARLGQERLVVKALSASKKTDESSSEELLFYHDGIESEVVDAYFDDAVVAQETARLLGQLLTNPPVTPGQISYSKDPDGKIGVGRSCRTNLSVSQEIIPGVGGETHLFQLEEAGSYRYRHLEMNTVGSKLVVELSMVAPPDDNPQAPGCQKLLRIGDRWEGLLGGSMSIKVIVTTNSKLRFYFRPLVESRSLWEGQDGVYKPFKLGAPVLSSNDAPYVKSRAIELKPLREPAPSPLLNILSLSDEQPLSLQELSIGSDQLRFKLAGKARISGTAVTLTDRMKMFPGLIAFLAAANVALLVLLRHLFFKQPTPDPTPDIVSSIKAETAAITQNKSTTSIFDVFLCHNSNDKDEVKAIKKQLEEHGVLTWLDEFELPPGRPWQELIEQQIKQIKSAAVFVGEKGIGPWQNAEFRGFLNQFVKRECPVIPVILPSCKNPPELPPFLERMTWVDFRRQEPDPMEQLIWGITGEHPQRKQDSNSEILPQA